MNKYTVYTYTVQRVRDSMGSKEGRGPHTDKTPAAKSLHRSIVLSFFYLYSQPIVLDNDIWHFFLSANLSTVCTNLVLRTAHDCTLSLVFPPQNKLRISHPTKTELVSKDGIHERTISLRFLGIILRFLILEGSIFVFVFLQNAFIEQILIFFFD